MEKEGEKISGDERRDQVKKEELGWRKKSSGYKKKSSDVERRDQVKKEELG